MQTTFPSTYALYRIWRVDYYFVPPTPMVNQSSSESHNLNLETFSSRIEMSNQIAAYGQTEITHMDADLCEAL